MHNGKKTCKILKEIRQQIAIQNDITFITSECHFQGECKGTCPKCEAELRYLENELNKRRQLGKVVTIAGISLGLAGSFAACNSPRESITDSMDSSSQASTEIIPIEVAQFSSLDSIKTPFRIDTETFISDGIILGGIEEENQYITDSKLEIIDFTDQPEYADEPPQYPMIEGLMPVTILDNQDDYPGGREAYRQFLKDNLKYPQKAIDEKIEGTVMVKFKVNKNGNISQISILDNIGFGCGKEAIRLIKMMPKWTPVQNEGKYVKSYYVLPVEFNLDSPNLYSN